MKSPISQHFLNESLRLSRSFSKFGFQMFCLINVKANNLRSEAVPLGVRDAGSLQNDRNRFPGGYCCIHPEPRTISFPFAGTQTGLLSTEETQKEAKHLLIITAFFGHREGKVEGNRGRAQRRDSDPKTKPRSYAIFLSPVVDIRLHRSGIAKNHSAEQIVGC